MYRDLEGNEFMTNIFEEIASFRASSIILAKVNHYARYSDKVVGSYINI